MEDGLGAERRYRDFVELSGDFAWEVDAASRFVFIAPRLVFGWPAHTLVGRKLTDFLIDPADSRHFTVPAAGIGDARFRTAEGGTVALTVTARSIFDAGGVWNGARGIARDRADPHARDLAFTEEQLREGVLRHVVRAVRDEPQPAESLAAALAALGFAANAAGGAVLHVGPNHAFRVAQSWGQKAPPPAMATLRSQLKAHEKVAVVAAGAQLVAQAVLYRQESKGAVMLWRRGEATAFSEGERTLLGEVADHIGIVIAEIEARERIDLLARTDRLTGLTNRSAFFDEFSRRLDRLDRALQSAALLYIDVDNLRYVNDVHGPARGDQALVALAGILREHTRAGDLIARFGGDEFVLWIEGIDRMGAMGRVAALADAAARLAALTGLPDRPFGISIGLAMFDPLRPESSAQIIARAAIELARKNN